MSCACMEAHAVAAPAAHSVASACLPSGGGAGRLDAMPPEPPFAALRRAPRPIPSAPSPQCDTGSTVSGGESHSSLPPDPRARSVSQDCQAQRCKGRARSRRGLVRLVYLRVASESPASYGADDPQAIRGRPVDPVWLSVECRLHRQPSAERPHGRDGSSAITLRAKCASAATRCRAAAAQRVSPCAEAGEDGAGAEDSCQCSTARATFKSYTGTCIKGEGLEQRCVAQAEGDVRGGCLVWSDRMHLSCLMLFSADFSFFRLFLDHLFPSLAWAAPRSNQPALPRGSCQSCWLTARGPAGLARGGHTCQVNDCPGRGHPAADSEDGHPSRSCLEARDCRTSTSGSSPPGIR